MTMILNFSSSNLCSVSLGPVSGDLFCSFTWATFPCYFGLRHTHLKTQPHLSSLETVFMQGQRGSGVLSNLSCGCIFSGLVSMNFQLERFYRFLFSGAYNFFAPSGVCLLYCRFVGEAASCPALLFSAIFTHLDYVRS